jgi:hypothetical protein
LIPPDYLSRIVGRPIVHEDDLIVDVFLSEDRVEGARQIPGIIVGGDYNRKRGF